MSDNIFGTDPHQLVRSDDPDTSHQAAHEVNTTKLEEMVYNVIKSFGSVGCISDDVIGAFPKMDVPDVGGTITPRYRALLNKGLIEDTGERRQGRSGRFQRVMRCKVGGQ